MVASFEPLDRLLKGCIPFSVRNSKLRSLYPLNSAGIEHLNQNGELGCGFTRTLKASIAPREKRSYHLHSKG